ncbi:MAG: hypothetical protein Q8P41_20305 [Pseudomonadota bacterium]|nr:hypothetical protein [Pseudomonadota bacterium]
MSSKKSDIDNEPEAEPLLDDGADEEELDETLDEDPDEDLDEDDDDEADEPWLLRLVRESELSETGRATPTGIHLTLYGPECGGLNAWDLGEIWGYSPPELEAMRLEGDHLVAILQSADERCGRATAETVANLIAALRPDAVGHEKADVLVRALTCTPAEAEQRGLRKLQRQIGTVLGIRDGAFGAGRLPPRGEHGADLTFFLDEKLIAPDANGLLPGSSLAIEDYPSMPTVVRLPWDDGDEPADDEEEA